MSSPGPQNSPSQTGATPVGVAIMHASQIVTPLQNIVIKLGQILQAMNQINAPGAAGYNINAATASALLTAADISGGTANVVLAMTGTLTGPANAQLPLVADLVAALSSPAVGTSYTLRVINESSANDAWTITTDTGWTLTGTMTIAQNTWREFIIQLTSLTTATLQSIGTGTYS